MDDPHHDGRSVISRPSSTNSSCGASTGQYSGSKVDRLSLYLQRVADQQIIEGEEEKKNEHVKNYVRKIFDILFTEDERFMTAFEPPDGRQIPQRQGSRVMKKSPKTSVFNSSGSSTNEMFLSIESAGTYNCPFYLKRFPHHTACVVYSGGHADLPPGCAIYRINQSLTSEEKGHLLRCHPLVIDSEGFVSPLRIYPWFAEGIELALLRLQGEEQDNSGSAPDVSLDLSPPLVTVNIDRGSGLCFRIHFYPAVKGYGWPAGVRLNHALPKHKPYCLQGKAFLCHVGDLINDGQSLWTLDAACLNVIDQHQKSARFKAGLRTYGSTGRFWKLSLKPVEDLMYQNLVQACESHEYNIDIHALKSVLVCLRDNHGWGSISDRRLEALLMLAFKRHLADMRSLCEAFIKTLSYMKECVRTGVCPSLLVPSINQLSSLSSLEAMDITRTLNRLIAETQERPAKILTYIGYGEKE